jgi:hypothetical protein
MRLQERIKIDDKEYTINELTVEEIIKLLSLKTDDGSNPNPQEEKITSVIGSIFGSSGYIKEFLNLAMPGTKLSDLIKLAPSEINQIWEKVQEVNNHFFDLTRKLEVNKILLVSAKEILNHFSSYAVVLSKEAMDQEFSVSDIPSS